MLFTGYIYKELNQIQKECYEFFDLVVEGRFDDSKKGSFLWRGSSNQIFTSPSNKYSDKILDSLYNKESAGLDIKLLEKNMFFYGIPTNKDEIELIKTKIIDKLEITILDES
jgi:hypothetical protein